MEEPPIERDPSLEGIVARDRGEAQAWIGTAAEDFGGRIEHYRRLRQEGTPERANEGVLEHESVLHGFADFLSRWDECEAQFPGWYIASSLKQWYRAEAAFAVIRQHVPLSEDERRWLLDHYRASDCEERVMIARIKAEGGQPVIDRFKAWLDLPDSFADQRRVPFEASPPDLVAQACDELFDVGEEYLPLEPPTEAEQELARKLNEQMNWIRRRYEADPEYRQALDAFDATWQDAHPERWHKPFGISDEELGR